MIGSGVGAMRTFREDMRSISITIGVFLSIMIAIIFAYAVFFNIVNLGGHL